MPFVDDSRQPKLYTTPNLNPATHWYQTSTCKVRHPGLNFAIHHSPIQSRPNHEIDEITLTDQGRFSQIRHVRRGRPLADQSDESPNRLSVSFHHHLDRSPVVAVANPAREPEQARLVLNKRAEANALDAPGDDAVKLFVSTLVCLAHRASLAFAADQSPRCLRAASASAT
jgi:hypothetical protein